MHSTVEIDNYHALYSELMVTMAELHSFNVIFQRTLGTDSRVDVGATLMKLRRIELMLIKSSKRVFRENVNNIKNGLAEKRRVDKTLVQDKRRARESKQRENNKRLAK